VGGEFFRTSPDQPWDPPILLNNGQDSFPEVKRPEFDFDHTPPSSTEVEERLELYLYSPSEPSWLVL
jgi:hypothetical protein